MTVLTEDRSESPFESMDESTDGGRSQSPSIGLPSTEPYLEGSLSSDKGVGRSNSQQRLAQEKGDQTYNLRPTTYNKTIPQIQTYDQDETGDYGSETANARSALEFETSAGGATSGVGDEHFDIDEAYLRFKDTRRCSKRIAKLKKVKDENQDAHEYEPVPTPIEGPIRFNYRGKLTCHFCASPAYGILGVKPDDTKRNTIPIMCEPCTTARFRFMICSPHTFASFSNPVPDETKPTDLTALYETSVDGPGKVVEWNGDLLRDQLSQIDTMLGASFEHLFDPSTNGKWCSICPAWATVRCEDCELTLCDQCAQAYDEGSALGDLVQTVRENALGRNWYLGPRADVEFLMAKGPLVKGF